MRLLSIMALAMLLAGCSPQTPEQRAAKRCTDKTMAFVMSQTFVKRALKAPSSAQFPSINEAVVTQAAPCVFTVLSHVDAQNSFGAMIRSQYTARMEYFAASDKWGASDVALAE